PGGSSGSPTTCKSVNSSSAAPNTGYVDPDPTVLKHFQTDQHAAWIAGGSTGTDPSTLLTCELTQLTPNVQCDTGANDGWCYIDTPGAVKGCTQAILFNKQALTAGVTTSLQCIEVAANVLGDGGAAAVLPSAPVVSSDAGTGGD